MDPKIRNVQDCPSSRLFSPLNEEVSRDGLLTCRVQQRMALKLGIVWDDLLPQGFGGLSPRFQPLGFIHNFLCWVRNSYRAGGGLDCACLLSSKAKLARP